MSYEVPSDERRDRKTRIEIDRNRNLAKFSPTYSTQADEAGIGAPSGGAAATGPRLGSLVMNAELHLVCIEISWTGATGDLKIGDLVDTTATAWQGKFLHLSSGTSAAGRGVFEPQNTTVFTDVTQTLSVTAGDWAGAAYTTGTDDNDRIVMQSASAIVEDITGASPTISTIIGAKNDGQFTTLKPIDTKTLTMTSGGNIDTTVNVTVEDDTFSILQFFEDNITPDASGSWSISGVSGGGSGGISSWKNPVRLTTTGSNITLSGEQTIDGFLTSADRVLVKDQTAGEDNGIYVSAAGAWVRSSDFNISAEVVAGVAMIIEEGTANADKIFILTTDNPITLGTTSLTFATGNIPVGTANNDHLEWNTGTNEWEALQILQYGQGNHSLTGQQRFTNDTITHGWRNFLDTGDILMKVTTGDLLQLANNVSTGATVGVILSAQDPVEAQNDFLIQIQNGAVATAIATIDTNTALFNLRVGGATRLDIDVNVITQMGLTSPSAQASFDLKNNSASPVALYQIGDFSATGRDSANNVQEFNRIRNIVQDPSTTVEKSQMQFAVTENGTLKNYLQMDGDLQEITVGDTSLTDGVILRPADDGLTDLGVSNFSWNTVYLDGARFMHATTITAAQRMIGFVASGDMHYNVPTADFHSFRIQDAETMRIEGVEVVLNTNKVLRFTATTDATINKTGTNPLIVFSPNGTSLTSQTSGTGQIVRIEGDLGGDELVPAQLIFLGDDSGGVKTEYGIIKSRIKDPIDLTERGNLEFEVNFGGGMTKMMEISGDNTDFGIEFFERVRIDTNQQLVMQGSFIEYTTAIANPGQTGIIRKLFTDSGNLNHLSVVTNTGVVDLEAGGGASLPVVDTTSIAEGSGDATKEVRFEVDGNTTGIVGVLATVFTTAKTVTFPNITGTLASLAGSQTFTGTKTFADIVVTDTSPVFVANSINGTAIVDNTIGTLELEDNAVNLAQMTHQADGSLITYSASTVPILLAPGAESEKLNTRGTGLVPTWEEGGEHAFYPWDLHQTTQFDFDVYMSNTMTGAAFSTFNVIEDVLYFVPFWLSRRRVVTRMGLTVSAATGTYRISVGIYSARVGQNYPLTKINDANTLFTGTGSKTQLITATLDPGLYFLAFDITDNNTINVGGYVAGDCNMCGYKDNTTSGMVPILGWSQTHTSSTLPTNPANEMVPLDNNNPPPAVFIKF